MGQEIECRARIGTRSRMEGKAYLETDYVLFRGTERFKVGFGELTGVKADGGVLKLEFAGGPLELELGTAAEKWARKILNPPSLMDKLGVKAGLKIRLIGEFPGEFPSDVAERQATLTKGKCDLAFLAVARTTQLDHMRKLKPNILPGGALWVVYPKGLAEIREIDVIQAGRAAGMKDVKVARFSATHTVLKFV
jgi:hypothetical protein